jgi:hypothetical protein
MAANKFVEWNSDLDSNDKENGIEKTAISIIEMTVYFLFYFSLLIFE